MIRSILAALLMIGATAGATPAVSPSCGRLIAGNYSFVVEAPLNTGVYGDELHHRIIDRIWIRANRDLFATDHPGLPTRLKLLGRPRTFTVVDPSRTPDRFAADPVADAAQRRGNQLMIFVFEGERRRDPRDPRHRQIGDVLRQMVADGELGAVSENPDIAQSVHVRRACAAN